MDKAVHPLRTQVFGTHWPLDEEITTASATLASHHFLANPSGQYLYVYLTRFVKALSEHHFQRPFSELSVLDWGCGKGQVSKLLMNLGARRLDSCDIVTEKADSAFDNKRQSLTRSEST